MRTVLRQRFPANREINREFRHFDSFGGNFAAEVSVPQRLLAEFPTKINRENFADIRDRNGDIRVIYWHIRAKAGAISDRQITQATRTSWCADSPSLKKQML